MHTKRQTDPVHPEIPEPHSLKMKNTTINEFMFCVVEGDLKERSILFVLPVLRKQRQEDDYKFKVSLVML